MQSRRKLAERILAAKRKAHPVPLPPMVVTEGSAVGWAAVEDWNRRYAHLAPEEYLRIPLMVISQKKEEEN